MNLLERYLGREFAKGYLVVLLVLLGLFGFLDLVDELSEVGEGNYRLKDAFIVVGLTFPTKILDFAAICTLMGGSFGLAGLAKGSELLAMRSSSMSVVQMVIALLKSVVIAALLLVVIAQFIAPLCERWAFLHRHQALVGSDSLRTEQGFWSRNRLQFLNVGTLLHSRVPEDLNIYQFDATGRLQQFIHAKRADIRDRAHWILEDVFIKAWNQGLLKTQHHKEWRWDSFLSTDQLQALELPAETLSVTDLFSYVQYLIHTGQNAGRYELLFWQRVLLPVTMAVMILLLVPIMVASPRAQSFGLQVVLAVMVGLLYFLATQVVANAGLLLGIAPLTTAMVPTLVVLAIALFLCRRAIWQ